VEKGVKELVLRTSLELSHPLFFEGKKLEAKIWFKVVQSFVSGLLFFNFNIYIETSFYWKLNVATQKMCQIEIMQLKRAQNSK